MNDHFGQRRFRVRLVWGPAGAAVAVRRGDIAVVVDVLSFTTALSVATDMGALVYPYIWGEESAADFARHNDATLAVGRRAARASGKVSLSPASIRASESLTRLVLPSPNGSSISFRLADAGATVVGACLRNRHAVASWVAASLAREPERSVTVVAAGERWRDGSLRPAVEDLWGAGAVVEALRPRVGKVSPEARSAAAAFIDAEGSLKTLLLECTSGQELVHAGFEEDVAIAAEVDASGSVPVLEHDCFTSAAPA